MTEPKAVPGVPSARKIRRDRIQAGLLALVFIFLPISYIFVGPTILKAYDATHRINVECTVDSAVSGAGSSHSLKGIGYSSAQVLFTTRECGVLVLQWKVNSGNEKQIAAEVKSGTRYHFDIGAGSYKIRSFLEVVRQAVYVKHFSMNED